MSMQVGSVPSVGEKVTLWVAGVLFAAGGAGCVFAIAYVLRGVWR